MIVRRGAPAAPRSVVALMLFAAACSSPKPRASARTSTTPASSSSTTATTAPVITTATSPASRTLELQRVVDAYAAAQSVPFSVVAVELRTGARAERLADRVVLSASLYKLFVARELLRRVSEGSLTRTAPAGDSRRRTVDECLRAMIIVSDNDCGQAGLRMVGGGALDRRLRADGYTATSLGSPQRTSASDVARFLLAARDHSLLGAGQEVYAAELYGWLQQQQVNDRFPAALASGTPIAHKTGDRLHWAHDAGVITTPTGDVLLAVLTGPWAAPCCDADKPGPPERAAFTALGGLAARVYAFAQRG